MQSKAGPCSLLGHLCWCAPVHWGQACQTDFPKLSNHHVSLCSHLRACTHAHASSVRIVTRRVHGSILHMQCTHQKLCSTMIRALAYAGVSGIADLVRRNGKTQLAQRTSRLPSTPRGIGRAPAQRSTSTVLQADKSVCCTIIRNHTTILPWSALVSFSKGAILRT